MTWVEVQLYVNTSMSNHLEVTMKSSGKTFNPGTVLFRYDVHICIMYFVPSDAYYCISGSSGCSRYRLIYEIYVKGGSPDCSITII